MVLELAFVRASLGELVKSTVPGFLKKSVALNTPQYFHVKDVPMSPVAAGLVSGGCWLNGARNVFSVYTQS